MDRRLQRLPSVGPVIAATREYLGRPVAQVYLDAVAVEFDLVDPARARWHSVNRGSQCRFDEAREWRRDSPGRPLWPRAWHGSDEPQSQLPGWTGMARNEVYQVIRNGCAFDIAAALNFSRDLARDIV